MSPLLGKLTADAIKHNPIIIGGGIMMLLSMLGVALLLTVKKKWSVLWKDWISSLDPKKIGIMYLVVTMLMLLKGVIDAMMIRAQQTFAVGTHSGYLDSEHFQQVFTAHGSTMIFFVGMGIVFGLMNLFVPLQIGARDVAFPLLNAIGFWLFAGGAALLNISLVVGEFSGAGWLAYPPLAELNYNPGVGIDYWIWTLQIAGVGSLISGINFLVTILKMRCPGMTLMRMPLFTWTALATLILVIFAFPILTISLGMLSLDRMLGMHFFTADMGGNQMMFVNLIWAWGHPEVYILVLPAFGIFSEVVATFSYKRLFGYKSMIWAIGAITFLSFIVWLHHFFTMGATANVNAFFGIMTMVIAVPTGVKVFNWLMTMYKGKVHFTSAMLWFLGFVVTFSIGGMAGMQLSIPGFDYQSHNSLFLVAHFHSMVIGGVLFGFLSGFTYLFPKIFGFKLDERTGIYAFRCWFSGFLIAFIPLYILGLMGVTRRLDHYQPFPGWQPLFIVAAFGAGLILLGVFFQMLQIAVSIKNRKKNADLTGDPWNGRTLEWATSSPPPVYNFARIPHVSGLDPFWEHKQGKAPLFANSPYEDIHLPKNTPIGFFIGGFSLALAFSLVWYIHWLSIVSLIGIIACLFVRQLQEETEEILSASEVEKMDRPHLNRT